MSRLFLGSLLLISVSSPSIAQPQNPAPAQPLGGPQVAGVCLLSQQAVLANAKVGAVATARLKQLADQAQAEVDAARKPIEADAKALEAQRATLKPADFQQKQAALGQRLQTLQQAAQVRSREIELTRQKALARIAGEAQPLIAAAYKAHGCGLLIDRGTVLGGNMGGDLTPAVVQAIDAKLTTISFERETLSANAASPAAPK